MKMRDKSTRNVKIKFNCFNKKKVKFKPKHKNFETSCNATFDDLTNTNIILPLKINAKKIKSQVGMKETMIEKESMQELRMMLNRFNKKFLKIKVKFQNKQKQSEKCCNATSCKPTNTNASSLARCKSREMMSQEIERCKKKEAKTKRKNYPEYKNQLNGEFKQKSDDYIAAMRYKVIKLKEITNKRDKYNPKSEDDMTEFMRNPCVKKSKLLMQKVDRPSQLKNLKATTRGKTNSICKIKDILTKRMAKNRKKTNKVKKVNVSIFEKEESEEPMERWEKNEVIKINTDNQSNFFLSNSDKHLSEATGNDSDISSEASNNVEDKSKKSKKRLISPAQEDQNSKSPRYDSSSSMELPDDELNNAPDANDNNQATAPVIVPPEQQFEPIIMDGRIITETELAEMKLIEPEQYARAVRIMQQRQRRNEFLMDGNEDQQLREDREMARQFRLFQESMRNQGINNLDELFQRISNAPERSVQMEVDATQNNTTNNADLMPMVR